MKQIADNFTQIVENTYTNPDGYAYVFHYMKGSQTGVTLSLQPGGFSVYELNNNIKTSNLALSKSTYNITYSGDCRICQVRRRWHHLWLWDDKSRRNQDL